MAADEVTADAVLDACGLTCPMPLLKAKLALNGLQPGQVLQVMATDAASRRDFSAYARLAGHSLLREEEQGGVFRYWLQKGG